MLQYFLQKPVDSDAYLSNYAMQLNPYWDNVIYSYYFSGEDRIGQTDIIPELNQWYHIDFIRDTANAELRTTIRDKDRVVIAFNSMEDTGVDPLTSVKDLLLGADFIGYIDEVRISNSIRSIDEALYAAFTADVTSGESSLAVNFADLSTGHPVSWEWDFENDGIIDSYDQNPAWNFNEKGSYTIALRISDGINSDTEIKTDYILLDETEVSLNDVKGSGFTIYPNPATGMVYIFSAEEIALSIWNATSQKILEKQYFTSGSIDISGFKKGIYFVIFTGENEIKSRLLIIE